MNQRNNFKSADYSGNRGKRNVGSQKIVPAESVKFFLDPEKMKLNPELLDTKAEQQANVMHGELNSAQLRRFFGEIKGIYSRLNNNEQFERLLPLIKMIRSKVYYALNPKNSKIPRAFGEFLLGGIEQVKDERDFEAFVLYFEAVVGFMYGKGLVKK